MNGIKTGFAEKVENKMRENFNNELKNGRKLTLMELKNLKSTWKADYVKHELQEDLNAL
jgi:hypothetical protein